MRDLLRSLEAGVLEVQTPDHAESSPDQYSRRFVLATYTDSRIFRLVP